MSGIMSSSEQQYYPYGLTDPRPYRSFIFYIGITTRPLHTRLTEHKTEVLTANAGSEAKNAYITMLDEAGYDPEIVMLPWPPHIPFEDWEACEQYWIKFFKDCYQTEPYKARGCKLTNQSLGGLGQKGLSHKRHENQNKIEQIDQKRQ